LIEEYRTLVAYAEEYNDIAESVNRDVEEATKNAFSLLDALSAVLSALWLALKSLF